MRAGFRKALVTMRRIAPTLTAVILLVGWLQTVVTPERLHALFSGDPVRDTAVGIAAGAVSVGQPFLSYILGGELLKEGISPTAVTAFILSWVTLGIIQLPLEWEIFGWRFTLVRNLLSLLFAPIVALAVTWSLELLR
jgi:uncharacterized membrane protein YraQ (UPF0718 family)